MAHITVPVSDTYTRKQIFDWKINHDPEMSFGL